MQIDLDGATLFFDVVGARLVPEDTQMREKPTLLVLHGGPGYDHSTLRPYFDRFSDAFQVIYIDHRGCGRSTGAQKDWHLDQWADDIVAFCDRLGITKPCVFGQSFGGMVAMHYACRHPDHPDKVIFSSTAAKFRMDATEDMMRQLGGDAAARLARQFFTTPSKELFEEYSELCGPLYTQIKGPRYDERAIKRPEIAVHFFNDEMKHMDMLDALGRVTCPALVLGGALDPVTPPICSEDIARAVAENAELHLFDGCGHGVHRDEPDRAEAVMRAFLTP